MSKVIEFNVHVFETGTKNIKVVKHLAKNLDRLFLLMPKKAKKKWVKISYVENGVEKTIENK